MVNRFRISCLAAIALALPLVAFAADPPKYEPRNEITLNGNTIYVATHPSNQSWTGIYAIMREGGGEIEVHLGPETFLLNGGIDLKTGDQVRIVGSKVRWNGTEIVLGREVTAKGTTLQLRDKSGTPLW